MQKTSFTENLDFNDTKIVTKVLLETSFSKEIRILMKNGQLMKEHKAPLPIIVHIVQGEIEFGAEGTHHTLKQGDIITLAANVPHDLLAKSDSIVRLTLSKQDAAERLEKVVADS
ncbi:quercetin dioxygenase-like cupin family protein [Maribacter spongiicola]|uniref:Quercetin dioxygenase-like cupin family protein n=1 Tax=Maribacter spongiicola TaxID=1206753 RepID=A0A4R7KAU5_9FLAO|nr:cupin domain-containing protein [Maribacter spongiicola]TDT50534.1 quercetin dioxygenase-like cupin family protein [Maribacter spongiicola]